MTEPNNAIALNKERNIGSFYTSLQNFEDGQRVGNMISQSSMVPDAYKGNLANCMIALEYAAKMKISPTDVMQNLVTVKGKLSWSATFIISMVNGCGLYSRLKFKVENKGDLNNMSCYAYTTELETGDLLEGTTITMQMAKGEGWTNNKKWQNMPEQMLKYRAASFFAREHCPELLNGIHSSEEVEDFAKGSPLDNIPSLDPSQYEVVEETFEDAETIIEEVKTQVVQEEVQETVINDTIEETEQLNLFEKKAQEVKQENKTDDLKQEKISDCGF